MISPNTKVLVLDTSTDDDNVYNGTIEGLYTKFAHFADNNGVINFQSKDVKITDWCGWTELNRIEKIDANDCKWYNIKVPDGRSVNISFDKYLVYKPQHRKIGFHGEVLYEFKLVDAADPIISGSFLRVRDIEDEDGVIKQFSPYTIELTQDELHGYLIFTKSNFFNANGIHMCSNNANYVENGFK